MAEQFIGLTVVVKLKSPPNTELRGLVANVAGQQLTLRNVIFPQTGYHVAEHRINSSEILDLDIQPTTPSRQTQPPPPAAPPVVQKNTFAQIYAGSFVPAPLQSIPVQPSYGHIKPPVSRTPESFVDPAILSFGKKPETVPGTADVSVPTKQELPSIEQDILVEAGRGAPSPLPLKAGKSKAPGPQFTIPKTRNNGTSATLSAPFNELDLNTDTDAFEETDGAGPVNPSSRRESILTVKGDAQKQVQAKNDGYTGKRSRRGGRARKDAALQAKLEAAGQDTPGIYLKPSTQKKDHGRDISKRWRQNMSEEPETQGPQTPGIISGSVARAAVHSSKRKARKQRAQQGDDQDGWATEEATDIQGLGEFDFQGNLSKFDKRTVFDQIKADDNTADTDRLVSFNRLPKAKTAPVTAKNLHHSENVLGPANGAGKWNSEAGDSEDDESTGDSDSDRGSRRVLSRQSARRMPSRKGSQTTGSVNMTMTASQMLNPLHRGRHGSSHGSSSKISRHSPSGGSPFRGPLKPTTKPSLRLLPSNRPCPVIKPVQMLEVEHANQVKVGLTETMMTENAARGIAEVAFLMLNPGGRRLTSENHNAPPVVVVLAGSGKNGARAIAGGRHLQTHGVRVLVCLLAERHDELSEDIHRQINLFSNVGGMLTTLQQLNADLKDLESPAELIIDALLGPQVAFKTLRPEDQSTVVELVTWTRKSKASVLAIDLPSGLDHTTGDLTVSDGISLHTRAKFVVSLGAPKTGLLNALSSGMGQSWQLFVADIGLGNATWREKGSKRKHGVEFGSKWVVGLRYQHDEAVEI